MSMRILLVHNRYRTRGGEDGVFEGEASLLERHGHQVTRLDFDNRSIPERLSLRESVSLAARTVWGNAAGRHIRDLALRANVDVVHFHNIFPLISPAAYTACRAAGIPVVQTIHNYRFSCPSAIFFRDGRLCEDCLGKSIPWPGVLHGCYRGSRAQTAVVATMLGVHHVRHTWQNDVDVNIVLSQFAREKLIAAGLPENRVIVKPNFVEPDPGPENRAGDNGFLFAGRLVIEKGLHVLLDAWSRLRSDAPLRIAGDGALAPQVARAARGDRVRFLGLLSREQVLARMRRSRALIFPSIWYESFPLIIVEAFACGLPVIASRLGASGEIVEDGKTGVLFDPGDPDDLARKVDWMWNHAEECRRMGDQARQAFEHKYSGSQNLQLLLEIYDQAIATAKGRSRDARQSDQA